jgi:hypothetical protein
MSISERLRLASPRLTAGLWWLLGAWVLWRYGQVIAAGGGKWQTADWLISYENGFVRRGLMGAAIFWLHDHAGWPVLITTFGIQSLAFLGAMGCVASLYFSRKRSLYWALFLFSPAFLLMFPLWDPPGGLRKELLLFLSYGVMFWGLGKIGKAGEGRGAGWRLVAAVVLYAIAVLSHELSALALPFFLYALNGHEAMPPFKRRAWMGTFTFVAMLGLGLSVAYPGSAAAQEGLCQAVVRAGLAPKLCSGALAWVGKSPAAAMASVMPYWRSYALLYPPLFVLALAPLLPLAWTRRRIVLLAVGLIALVPLFLVAIDWGRWLHIYITMVFMTLLHDDQSTPVCTLHWHAGWMLACVLTYALTWGMPHCCAMRPIPGVLSLF